MPVLKTLKTWTTKEGKRRHIRWYSRWHKNQQGLSYEEWRESVHPHRRYCGNRKPLRFRGWRTKTGDRRIIRLYGVWQQMCWRTSPRCSARDRAYYYEKGIRVCQEWQDYDAFRKWAVAAGYGKNLTIDRIDSDKDYHPDNCEWVTRAENARRVHTCDG
jgi:hypothetical protein